MVTHDWKAILGNAANAAVIVASLAVVAAVVVDLHGTRRVAPDPEVRLSSLRNGVKVPRIAGVDYSGSERTLLLFLSVHCQYCQQSVPFYRELVAAAAGAPGKAPTRRVLAVFSESAADVGEFEDRENFNVEAVSGFRFQDFAVSGTPTAVLLSREGRVLQVWRGAPSKEMQDAMRAALLSI